MSSVFARAATCTVVLAAAFTGTAGPAQGAESVHITAHEVFGGASTFTSTIPGCASGTVTTVGDHTSFVRPFGKFTGFKVFECSAGGRFVIRLSAKFGETGSTGTWAFVGGVGGLAGGGTLVGTPAPPDGITDVYDGTLRR